MFAVPLKLHDAFVQQHIPEAQEKWRESKLREQQRRLDKAAQRRNGGSAVLADVEDRGSSEDDGDDDDGGRLSQMSGYTTQIASDFEGETGGGDDVSSEEDEAVLDPPVRLHGRSAASLRACGLAPPRVRPRAKACRKVPFPEAVVEEELVLDPSSVMATPKRAVAAAGHGTGSSRPELCEPSSPPPTPVAASTLRRRVRASEVDKSPIVARGGDAASDSLPSGGLMTLTAEQYIDATTPLADSCGRDLFVEPELPAASIITGPVIDEDLFGGGVDAADLETPEKSKESKDGNGGSSPKRMRLINNKEVPFLEELPSC